MLYNGILLNLIINHMEKRQIYRCPVCGNVVEVLYVGGGTLVCCGQPMELQEEHTQDAGMEKHIPVIEQKGTYVTVKVGDIPHPMEENHYIEWIEYMVTQLSEAFDSNIGPKQERIRQHERKRGKQ